MIKQKKEQISNIRNEKGDITVESTDIKKGSYGNIINNFMQRFITWMKLTNSLKKTKLIQQKVILIAMYLLQRRTIQKRFSWPR